MSSITCSQSPTLTKVIRLGARQSLPLPFRSRNRFLHPLTRRFRPEKQHPRETYHNTTATTTALPEAAEVL